MAEKITKFLKVPRFKRRWDLRPAQIFELAGTKAEAECGPEGIALLVTVDGEPRSIFYPPSDGVGHIKAAIDPEVGAVKVYIGKVSQGRFFAHAEAKEAE